MRIAVYAQGFEVFLEIKPCKDFLAFRIRHFSYRLEQVYAIMAAQELDHVIEGAVG